MHGSATEPCNESNVFSLLGMSVRVEGRVSIPASNLIVMQPATGALLHLGPCMLEIPYFEFQRRVDGRGLNPDRLHVRQVC